MWSYQRYVRVLSFVCVVQQYRCDAGHGVVRRLTTSWCAGPAYATQRTAQGSTQYCVDSNIQKETFKQVQMQETKRRKMNTEVQHPPNTMQDVLDRLASARHLFEALVKVSEIWREERRGDGYLTLLQDGVRVEDTLLVCKIQDELKAFHLSKTSYFSISSFVCIPSPSFLSPPLPSPPLPSPPLPSPPLPSFLHLYIS